MSTQIMNQDFDIGDAVKFFNDDRIYEVTGLITDQHRVFCYDDFEFEKQFNEIETIWVLKH